MEKLERPANLKDQVVSALRKSIIAGELKTGEQIVEAKLAAEMGISRGPIREAIGILEGEGFLTRADGCLTVTTLTRKDIYEIYSLRSVIEGLAARIAVEKFKPDDIAYMEKVLWEIARADPMGDGTVTVKSSLAIHRFIMDKADHKRLLDLWLNLNMQLKMLASMVMTHDTITDTFSKHTKLIEALKSGDPDIAEQAMRKHIMDSWRIVEKQLGNTSL
jgi:DNA-binding GntR family transcriptional regulator